MLFKGTPLALLLVIIIVSPVLAELPHAFKAGQTAKASEINENFQYINRTNYVLKANGVLVGDVISVMYNYAYVINERNFRVPVSTGGGVVFDRGIQKIYTEQNCIGVPYVSSPVMNTVFRSGAALYYVLTTQTPEAVTYNSLTNAATGICENTDLSIQATAIKAIANDRNVTGVQNDYPGSPPSFSSPITIEVR